MAATVKKRTVKRTSGTAKKATRRRAPRSAVDSRIDKLEAAVRILSDYTKAIGNWDRNELLTWIRKIDREVYAATGTSDPVPQPPKWPPKPPRPPR